MKEGWGEREVKICDATFARCEMMKSPSTQMVMQFLIKLYPLIIKLFWEREDTASRSACRISEGDLKMHFRGSEVVHKSTREATDPERGARRQR
jgi:hypothetical protein